eukprot:6190937-Pleurochrysis_carterae.AAC.2
MIGNYVWSVARPGIGKDTQREKEGCDDTSRKARSQAESNGQATHTTTAEAELFAIFAILKKVQAQQIMGHYGSGRARHSDQETGKSPAPEGMIVGLISKQVKSRPLIYSRKVQGQIELADGPMYREARKRGKKVIRDIHKPPEGGDQCKVEVARGMTSIGKVQSEEGSDIQMEIERQEGRREMEK